MRSRRDRNAAVLVMDSSHPRAGRDTFTPVRRPT